MLLECDRTYKITDSSDPEKADRPAGLLRDYLTVGSMLQFGRLGARWFWRLQLPAKDQLRLPSEVAVLLTNKPSSERMQNPIQRGWFLLKDRTPIKGTNPFNRTIRHLTDLPYESLFECCTGDFVVHIELPRVEYDLIGFKDSCRQVFIASNDKTICDRLAVWLDARTSPMDIRSTADTTCYIGFSELPFALRVPIYSDALLPQLLAMPQDIVGLIKSDVDLLQRGLLIAGLPGSGKTTSCKLIVSGVLSTARSSSLFLADVKGEYESWCAANGVRYLAAGRNPFCLRDLLINPFIPADPVRLISHIDSLALLIAAGSSGGGVLLPSYIKIFLEEFYYSLLWTRIRKDDWPESIAEGKLRLLNATGLEVKRRLGGDLGCFDNMHTWLVRFWRDHSAVVIGRLFGNASHSNGRSEIESAIASRISFFETSVFQYFCYEKGVSVDRLLTERICVSLQGFSKPALQLLMGVFCTLGFEALLAGEEKAHLSHLFLLEESHLVAGRPVEAAEIFTVDKVVADIIERGLTEGRSKGMGIILTDQQPGTRLMPSVLANTNIKICHNLLGRDSKLLAESMGMRPDTDFSCLGVGEAYVKTADHLPAYRSRFRL